MVRATKSLDKQHPNDDEEEESQSRGKRVFGQTIYVNAFERGTRERSPHKQAKPLPDRIEVRLRPQGNRRGHTKYHRAKSIPELCRITLKPTRKCTGKMEEVYISHYTHSFEGEIDKPHLVAWKQDYVADHVTHRDSKLCIMNSPIGSRAKYLQPERPKSAPPGSLAFDFDKMDYPEPLSRRSTSPRMLADNWMDFDNDDEFGLPDSESLTEGDLVISQDLSDSDEESDIGHYMESGEDVEDGLGSMRSVGIEERMPVREEILVEKKVTDNNGILFSEALEHLDNELRHKVNEEVTADVISFEQSFSALDDFFDSLDDNGEARDFEDEEMEPGEETLERQEVVSAEKAVWPNENALRVLDEIFGEELDEEFESDDKYDDNVDENVEETGEESGRDFEEEDEMFKDKREELEKDYDEDATNLEKTGEDLGSDFEDEEMLREKRGELENDEDETLEETGEALGSDFEDDKMLGGKRGELENDEDEDETLEKTGKDLESGFGEELENDHGEYDDNDGRRLINEKTVKQTHVIRSWILVDNTFNGDLNTAVNRAEQYPNTSNTKVGHPRQNNDPILSTLGQQQPRPPTISPSTQPQPVSTQNTPTERSEMLSENSSSTPVEEESEDDLTNQARSLISSLRSSVKTPENFRKTILHTIHIPKPMKPTPVVLPQNSYVNKDYSPQDDVHLKRPARRVQSSQEQPSQEQPSRGQPHQERPYQEQPSQEQPSQKQPSRAQPYQERPYQEQPYQEQPSSEQSFQGQPYQERPYQEQPSQKQPSQEQPSQEQPFQGQPYQERPYQNQLSQKQQYQEQPYQEKPSQEQPYQEQPNVTQEQLSRTQTKIGGGKILEGRQSKNVESKPKISPKPKRKETSEEGLDQRLRDLIGDLGPNNDASAFTVTSSAQQSTAMSRGSRTNKVGYVATPLTLIRGTKYHVPYQPTQNGDMLRKTTIDDVKSMPKTNENTNDYQNIQSLSLVKPVQSHKMSSSPTSPVTQTDQSDGNKTHSSTVQDEKMTDELDDISKKQQPEPEVFVSKANENDHAADENDGPYFNQPQSYVNEPKQSDHAARKTKPNVGDFQTQKNGTERNRQSKSYTGKERQGGGTSSRKIDVYSQASSYPIKTEQSDQETEKTQGYSQPSTYQAEKTEGSVQRTPSLASDVSYKRRLTFAWIEQQRKNTLERKEQRLRRTKSAEFPSEEFSWLVDHDRGEMKLKYSKSEASFDQLGAMYDLIDERPGKHPARVSHTTEPSVITRAKSMDHKLDHSNGAHKPSSLPDTTPKKAVKPRTIAAQMVGQSQTLPRNFKLLQAKDISESSTEPHYATPRSNQARTGKNQSESSARPLAKVHKKKIEKSVIESEERSDMVKVVTREALYETMGRNVGVSSTNIYEDMRNHQAATVKSTPTEGEFYAMYIEKKPVLMGELKHTGDPISLAKDTPTLSCQEITGSARELDKTKANMKHDYENIEKLSKATGSLSATENNGESKPIKNNYENIETLVRVKSIMVEDPVKKLPSQPASKSPAHSKLPIDTKLPTKKYTDQSTTSKIENHVVEEVVVNTAPVIKRDKPVANQTAHYVTKPQHRTSVRLISTSTDALHLHGNATTATTREDSSTVPVSPTSPTERKKRGGKVGMILNSIGLSKLRKTKSEPNLQNEPMFPELEENEKNLEKNNEESKHIVHLKSSFGNNTRPNEGKTTVTRQLSEDTPKQDAVHHKRPSKMSSALYPKFKKFKHKFTKHNRDMQGSYFHDTYSANDDVTSGKDEVNSKGGEGAEFLSNTKDTNNGDISRKTEFENNKNHNPSSPSGSHDLKAVQKKGKNKIFPVSEPATIKHQEWSVKSAPDEDKEGTRVATTTTVRDVRGKKEETTEQQFPDGGILNRGEQSDLVTKAKKSSIVVRSSYHAEFGERRISREITPEGARDGESTGRGHVEDRLSFISAPPFEQTIPITSTTLDYDRNENSYQQNDRMISGDITKTERNGVVKAKITTIKATNSHTTTGDGETLNGESNPTEKQAVDNGASLIDQVERNGTEKTTTNDGQKAAAHEFGSKIKGFISKVKSPFHHRDKHIKKNVSVADGKYDNGSTEEQMPGSHNVEGYEGMEGRLCSKATDNQLTFLKDAPPSSVRQEDEMKSGSSRVIANDVSTDYIAKKHELRDTYVDEPEKIKPDEVGRHTGLSNNTKQANLVRVTMATRQPITKATPMNGESTITKTQLGETHTAVGTTFLNGQFNDNDDVFLPDKENKERRIEAQHTVQNVLPPKIPKKTKPVAQVKQEKGLASDPQLSKIKTSSEMTQPEQMSGDGNHGDQPSTSTFIPGGAHQARVNGDFINEERFKTKVTKTNSPSKTGTSLNDTSSITNTTTTVHHHLTYKQTESHHQRRGVTSLPVSADETERKRALKYIEKVTVRRGTGASDVRKGRRRKEETGEEYKAKVGEAKQIGMDDVRQQTTREARTGTSNMSQNSKQDQKTGTSQERDDDLRTNQKDRKEVHSSQVRNEQEKDSHGGSGLRVTQKSGNEQLTSSHVQKSADNRKREKSDELEKLSSASDHETMMSDSVKDTSEDELLKLIEDQMELESGDETSTTRQESPGFQRSTPPVQSQDHGNTSTPVAPSSHRPSSTTGQEEMVKKGSPAFQMEISTQPVSSPQEPLSSEQQPELMVETPEERRRSREDVWKATFRSGVTITSQSGKKSPAGHRRSGSGGSNGTTGLVRRKSGLMTPPPPPTTTKVANTTKTDPVSNPINKGQYVQESRSGSISKRQQNPERTVLQLNESMSVMDPAKKEKTWQPSSRQNSNTNLHQDLSIVSGNSLDKQKVRADLRRHSMEVKRTADSVGVDGEMREMSMNQETRSSSEAKRTVEPILKKNTTKTKSQEIKKRNSQSSEDLATKIRRLLSEESSEGDDDDQKDDVSNPNRRFSDDTRLGYRAKLSRDKKTYASLPTEQRNYKSYERPTRKQKYTNPQQSNNIHLTKNDWNKSDEAHRLHSKTL